MFQKVLFDEFLLVHFAVCFDGDFCFVVLFGDDQFCLILADLDGVAVVFECLDDSLCLVDGVCFCERGDVDGVCCCPAVGEDEYRFVLCWEFFCF